MKIILNIAFTLLLLFIQVCSEAAPADVGKLRIKADVDGAYIFVDGKKKAMINKQSWTNILLAEGEYQIKVEKTSEDGDWLYTQTKKIFVGADTSQQIQFSLDKQATAERKQREAESKRLISIALKQNNNRGKGTVYKDNGDGTITDTSTGLIWMRCSLGQTWNGTTCTGKTKEYEWQDAINTAKTVHFAGKTWRMPTIDELHTLVYCSKGRRDIQRDAEGRTVKIDGKYQDGECAGEGYQQPTINTTIFPNTPVRYFWSSSPFAYNSSYAWLLDFYDGYDNYDHRYHALRVRLVRSEE